MKINPGKGADYMKLERTWKEVHEERVKKGQIESWNLFTVVYPGGAKREYDAIAIHVYPSFDKMEHSYDEGQIAKIRTFPVANELRQMVRYEAWEIGHSIGDPFAGK